MGDETLSLSSAQRPLNAQILSLGKNKYLNKKFQQKIEKHLWNFKNRLERGKKYLQYWVRRHPFADKTKHLANRILRHSHILWEERCHGSELEGRWGKGLNGFLEGREDASVGLGLSSNRWISHLGSSPASDRCRSSFVNCCCCWNSPKAQA